MSINFTINKKPYTVELSSIPAATTLNTFIREFANLPGTKFMCLEGGCGACICVIKGRHPVTNDMTIWATNSCLTMINVCDGWDILTIEGIGNRLDGYHPIQLKLANLNGSQCGYCSPGMVMNMYALIESKGNALTMEEIENSFGGNICRCTGYRPILDAMKSFSRETDFVFVDNAGDNLCCKDIEDLQIDKKSQCKKMNNTGSECLKECLMKKEQRSISKDGVEWVAGVKNLKDLLEILHKFDEKKKYMLVAGNTAHGVYRRPDDIEAFIDVNKVEELHKITMNDDMIEFGGNVSLTEAMNALTAVATKPGFEYCKILYDHFDLIANVPVRNMGTLAGNLTIKHEHMEFPSDVFIIFEALDAQITITDDTDKSNTVTIQEYLNMNMNRKVIKAITLRKYPSSEYMFNSYKIMPRAQNAHAYVNAAFLLKISPNDGNVKTARICFGGIKHDFIHANKTESYLIGKDLFDSETFKTSMETLQSELITEWILPDSSEEYRKLLACGLFYKFVLSFIPEEKINKKFMSGGYKLHRELSSGLQTFETNEKEYPLRKPIPKIQSLVQCAGEAQYMNDFPNVFHQLWGAFVHATEVNVQIAEINPSEALKIPGVIAFFSAKDIPGKNSFVFQRLGYETEEIFCSGRIKYHSQPVGMIIAENMRLANFAAKKVKVMYEHQEGPVMVTMEEVFKHKAYHRIQDTFKLHSKDNIKLVADSSDEVKGTKKISGYLDIGGQYHFAMEPHTTICIPTETGMDVYSSTQWMSHTQSAICQALNVKASSVRLQVRRLGGAYGCKISRGNLVACAAALACKLLNKPIRFVQTIESMMSSIGKRYPCHSAYKVQIDDKGKIIKLQNSFYQDAGSTTNESPTKGLSTVTAKNCYESDGNWDINGKEVITDAPSHTWCRAPGAVEGIAMIENIMEHIARETGRDPVDVRMENIGYANKMKTLLPEFTNDIDYKRRREEIQKFNEENRWKKRGIGISLMQYPFNYYGIFPILVTIYSHDGSVGISHGGIEMGQGLHTKVAQVAAHILEIPLEMITIEPSDNLIAPNATVTGGAVSSESVCFAAKKACEDLLLRLKPVRDSMKEAKWFDVIQRAAELNINLVATNAMIPSDVKGYNVWGIACAECDIDILTGNVILKRVDILEDTGESLSPLIDIGQIEGGFVMGLGYWLTEQLVYNQETGELLTNRTWSYKPPGAKDIPVDFRIHLLQKSPNPVGVLRSKATGEPATCLAICAQFAVRHALDSAREDAGIEEKWYHLGAPTMPEHIALKSGNTPQMFQLK